MNCPNCQHTVHSGSKFCHECGHKLPLSCPSCQEPITIPDAKFCFECGYQLTETKANLSPSAAQPPKTSTTPVVKQAERRQLTVAFCDLVGSTAMSEVLDMEEFRQVILDYQSISEKVIKDFGGNVGNYLGDGLLVYFGYPVGLENAPRVGIKCALAILEAIASQNIIREKQRKPLIDVRIGVHTGMVVVDDHLALGDTTNIAARIESIAETNTIAISAKTHNMTKGWFVTEPLGSHQLKGISTPLELYKVIAESEIRNKFEISDQQGLTPLFGREEPLNKFLDGLANIRTEDKSFFIQGEAGIGKSRLIQEIRLQHRQIGVGNIVNFYSSSHHQNSPYFPFKDYLEKKILAFTNVMSKKDKVNNLRDVLGKIGIEEEDHFYNIAEIFDLATEIENAPSEFNNKIEDTLSEILIRLASKSPLIVIAEDVQWSDPSMKSWLIHFASVLNNHHILLIVSSRNAYDDSWPISKSLNSNLIELNHLTRDDTSKICKFLANDKNLPAQVIDQITRRADGVPLFIEELTRIILESGALVEKEDHYQLLGSIEDLMIPSSLRDSLMARLDQLNVYKTIIQLGSVIGREFDYDILELAANVSPTHLKQDLDRLVEKGFLYEKGKEGRKSYVFKSAMIQEIAYESLLKSIKRTLHKRVAEIIENNFNERVRPETLAWHYAEGNVPDKAIILREAASANAVRMGAYKEAYNHISKAKEIFTTLPQNEQIAETELRLQIQYCSNLRVIKGWNHPEVQKEYDLCLEIAKNVGESLELFQTLFGIWVSYLIDGNTNKAIEIAKDLIAMGERGDSSDMLLYGSLALSNVYFYRGDPYKGDEYLWKYNNLYDVEKREFYIQKFGLEPKVFHSVLALWFPLLQGDYAEYKSRIETLDKTVAEFNNPFSTTALKTSEAIASLISEEEAYGLKKANEILEITKDQEYSFYPLWANVAQGLAFAQMGKVKEGLAQALRGKKGMPAEGSNTLTLISSAVAKIHIMNNDYESALQEVAFGFENAERNDERAHEAELWRIKAIALGQLNIIKEAEEAFENSLHSAERLKLPLFKFRTLISMFDYYKDNETKMASLKAELQKHITDHPQSKGFKEYEEAVQLLNLS